jgi:hypothetical protein
MGTRLKYGGHLEKLANGGGFGTNMNNNYDDAELMLRTLGYSPFWIEAGVVQIEDLPVQYAAYKESEDADSAHFRHRAFVTFLEKKESIDNATLSAIRNLDDHSQLDSSLAQSRLIEVIRRHLLNESQLHELREDSSIAVIRPINCAIERELVKNALAENSIGRVRGIIRASKDPETQRIAVDWPGCSTDDLKWLEANGVTRAVRNLAMQRLKQSVKSG